MPLLTEPRGGGSGRPADRRDRPGDASLLLEIDLRELAERVAKLVLERLDDLRAPASPWLDLAGAAEYLGCSPERLRKLVQRRAIPFHQERAGGRIFFHRRELDEWLLAQ